MSITKYYQNSELRNEQRSVVAIMNKDEFEKIRKPGAIHWPDACVIHDAIVEHKPETVLELGCFMGISTLVLLDAMEEAKCCAWFVSVDIVAPGELFNIKDVKEARRSQLVPDNAPVELVTSDALKYLKGLPDESIDFIFEDTTHQIEYTANMIPEMLRVLKPNGIVLFHNLELYSMKEAFKKVKLLKKVKLFPPSWMGQLRKVNGVWE